MLIITSWFGRLGNNIIQLLNAIHYAKLKNHKIIRFPVHKLLSTTTIEISNNDINDDNIKDTFFI